MRPTPSEVLCALVAALILVEACRRPAHPPTADDELAELSAALEGLETTLPAARLLCASLAEHERRFCDGRLDALEDAATVARGLLVSAAACREQADAACLREARDTAATLLPVLRQVAGAP